MGENGEGQEEEEEEVKKRIIRKHQSGGLNGGVFRDFLTDIFSCFLVRACQESLTVDRYGVLFVLCFAHPIHCLRTFLLLSLPRRNSDPGTRFSPPSPIRNVPSFLSRRHLSPFLSSSYGFDGIHKIHMCIHSSGKIVRYFRTINSTRFMDLCELNLCAFLDRHGAWVACR